MATLTTLTTLKQTLPLSGNTFNNLRDVSFSSYLSTTDDNFVHRLADSSRSLAPSIQENDALGRKKEDDNGEIGVFGAEKYFNGVVEVDHSPRISKYNIPNYKLYNDPKEHVDLLPPKPKLIQPSSTSTTASVRSECSWNSQSTLLQQNSHTKTNKPNRKTKKGFLAGLGCNCMCSDSDSIDVEDQHLGDISFKKGTSNQIPQDHIHLSVVQNLEPQRKTLEVFGSPLQDKKSKSFRMDQTMSKTGYSSSALPNEDSDASSSDLFEIESLTGKTSTFLGSPTTCYAPSEASIQWSVVTASAADFDCEEIRPPPVAANFLNTKTAVGDTRRRCSSMSLGCNSSKAVGVSDRIITNGNPILDQRLHRVSGSYMPAAIRFPAENNMKSELEFDSTPRQRAFSTLSLPRSLPSHPSHLFFIH